MGVITIDKADVFRADAEAAGWKATVTRNGDVSTVCATKDNAMLSISWKGQACLNESWLQIGDAPKKKIRNAGAMRRILTGEDRHSAPAERKSPKRSAPITHGEDDEGERFVPPEPIWGRKHETAPAAEIIEAVKGKIVSWYNDKKRELQAAGVPKEPKHLRIEISPVTRRRVVTFAAVGDGFRSVYVDRIVDVR